MDQQYESFLRRLPAAATAFAAATAAAAAPASPLPLLFPPSLAFPLLVAGGSTSSAARSNRAHSATTTIVVVAVVHTSSDACGCWFDNISAKDNSFWRVEIRIVAGVLRVSSSLLSPLSSLFFILQWKETSERCVPSPRGQPRGARKKKPDVSRDAGAAVVYKRRAAANAAVVDGGGGGKFLKVTEWER